jgi:elongation factor Ts
MAEVTAKMIKELRDRTGVGMGKCKNALVEAAGDIDTAIANLRKAGMTSAVKKEGRETKEGLIGTKENDTAISLVEVNAETDFVVQNEKFSNFIEELCDQSLQKHPDSVEDFLKEPYAKDPSLTIEECRNLMVQSFGENVVIRNVKIVPKDKDTSIGVYSHMGGKVVTLVTLKGASGHEEFARQLAMHVAAEDPDYLSSDEIPAEVKQREYEIGKEQVKGKPENIIDKIVEGKYKAFCDQVCFINQKYIKDSSLSIAQVVEKYAKEKGVSLEVKGFIRWQIGQSS